MAEQGKRRERMSSIEAIETKLERAKESFLYNTNIRSSEKEG